MTNDPEALALGRFYAFIHQRAEFLRKQKAAGDSVSEADPPAAHSTSAQKQAQPGVYTNGKK